MRHVTELEGADQPEWLESARRRWSEKFGSLAISEQADAASSMPALDLVTLRELNLDMSDLPEGAALQLRVQSTGFGIPAASHCEPSNGVQLSILYEVV